MNVTACPLCQNQDFADYFSLQGYQVVKCTGCSLVMLNPQPDDDALNQIYTDDYFIGANTSISRNHSNRLKRATARLQINEIIDYAGPLDTFPAPPKLLEIGCGLGNFLFEAQNVGFDVEGIDVSESAVQNARLAVGEHRVRSGDVETAGYKAESYDIVVLADVIEHVRDPQTFMDFVNTLLKPNGTVFIAIPSLDSWSAKIMRRHWMEYKPEHLFYFDRKTVAQLLKNSGYEHIKITTGKKNLSLDYIIGHFDKFPVPVITPLMRGLRVVLPKRLSRLPFHITASGINIMAIRPR